MIKGELAPNNITAEILRTALQGEAFKNGYILDGWARQLSDLEQFDPEPDLVVVLNISRETSIKRVSGRRLCSLDGETYNIYTMPPEDLKKCHGTLTQREDDTTEAVNKRLDIYYNSTVKVLDFYKKKGVLVELDGEGSPDEVFSLLVAALGIK
jgi:adenylate kinase